MSQIKILIVDNHPIVCDGIKANLAAHPDIYVCGSAYSGLEALEFLAYEKVDVVLMDIQFEAGMEGYETTEIIKDRWPNIKVIAITYSKQRRHLKKMIQAGARGYLLKESDPGELANAIRITHQGGNYFSNKVPNILLQDMLLGQDSQKKRTYEGDPSELTNREKEVLSLIHGEFTANEIADKMGISRKTVETHKRNLMQKTGARNMVGLANFAVRHGLVEV